MIVNQCNCTHYLLVRLFPDFLHKLIANQIPKCFRTVRVASILDQGVKLGKQAGINSNTNAAEFTHSYIVTPTGFNQIVLL